MSDMTLNEKQAVFTLKMAELIIWAFNHNLPVIGSELYRTPEQAEIYAKSGKGILNSNHCKKLAIDLFAVDPDTGHVTWDEGPYQKLGKIWKTLHPLARWGGDFKNRDSVHFSFEHNGVS